MGKKFTALGADIFAGLFTHGVKQAGFDILGHLEHGTYGVKTARLNYPDLDIRVGRENWNEQEFKGKVDFLYTNPPCAAWSNAAQRIGARDGSSRGAWDTQLDRLRCVHDCVEAGLVIKPKAWCWESVTNAWGMGREFVIHQAEKWNDAGYHCTVLLQDNQYLGTPQERRRMFLIAHLHPLVWPKLTKTTTVAETFAKMKMAKQTGLRERKLNPLLKWLYPFTKRNGGYFRAAFEAEGRNGLEGGRPSVMIRRLIADRAAPVMTDYNHRMHPSQQRHLNWSEWLALCGLPPTWKTSCPSTTQASIELSRAVLPPVGKWLATAVRDGLSKPKLKGQPTISLYDVRDPDNVRSEVLSTFEGFTTKRFNPPPLPLLKKKVTK